MNQPPPEKPWPNEPKPPRLTLPWPESDDVPDPEWLEESLLKKLDRDEEPDPPLPPEELLLLLLLHAVLVCIAGSAPGGGGSQCCRGISA
jgi:hypothetical protein